MSEIGNIQTAIKRRTLLMTTKPTERKEPYTYTIHAHMLEKTMKHQRALTIVTVFEAKDQQYRTGVAILNPREKNYSRKLGFTIALGRAIKNPFRTATSTSERPDLAEIKGITTSIMEKIHSRPEVMKGLLSFYRRMPAE